MPRLAHSPFVTHIPVGVQCSLIPPASFVNGISSPSGKTPYYDLAASTLPDLAIEMTKTRSTGKNLPKCRHSGDMSDMSACDSMYNVCIFMSSTERVGIDLDGRRYFLASAAAADFGFTPDHIARLARQGKINGRRIGKKWYVEPESLRAYLKTLGDLSRPANLSSEAPERTSAERIAHHMHTRGRHTMRDWSPPNEASERRQSVSPVFPLASLALAIILSTGAAYAAFNPTGASTIASRVQSQFAAASADTSIFDRAAQFLFRAVCPIFKSCDLTDVRIADYPNSGGANKNIGSAPVPRQAATTVPTSPSQAASTSSALASSASSAAANPPIVQRIVERIVERALPTYTIAQGGITEAILNDHLNQLDNKLSSQISSLSASLTSIPYSLPASGGITNTIALSQHIDNLDGTHIARAVITDATISGGNVTATSFSGLLGVGSGGTGTSTSPTYGKLLVGNSAGGYDLLATSSLGISAGGIPGGSDRYVQFNNGDVFGGVSSFTFASSTGLLTVPFASTTALTISGTASTSLFFANGLSNCSSNNNLTWLAGTFGCEPDDTSAGAANPFAWEQNYATVNAATSSVFWAKNGLNASSTSHFANASTTLLTIGTQWFTSLANSGLGVDANGRVYAAATSTLANISGTLALTQLENQAANTVLANLTGGSAAPTAISTTTLFTGLPGQTLAFLNGGWIGVGTTTLTNGTGISASYSDGTWTITNTGATFAFPFTTNSTYGTTSAATSSSIQTAGVFFASSTAAASQFPFASTTALSAGTLCISTDCRTTWPTGGGSGDPFPVHTSYAGLTTSGTSSTLWLTGATVSLAASSSVLTFASSTAFTASGSAWFATDAGSKVGIGTTSPWALLSINPNGITGPAFVIGSSTATNFIVANNGYVGIGSASPNYALDVNGDINVATGKCFRVNGVCIGYTVKLSGIQAGTSTTTWTKPANLSYAVVELWGGGGGGGGGSTSLGTCPNVPQAGGGGGYMRKYFSADALSATTSVRITVGSGGTGGAASCNAFSGTAGGTTNFGGLASSTGGGGGGGGGVGVATIGAGGVGQGGDINLAGEPSAVTRGGASPFGGQGAETSANASFNAPGGAPFGGGGGAGQSYTGTAGGAGGVGGYVIYTYATSSPNSAGNDYAEMFPVSSPGITAGDIVAVDAGVPVSMKLAAAGDVAPLAGIIATDPGQLLGDKDAVGSRPVALSGRVPAKVNLEGGPIQIGDRIAPSSVPGVGKKAGPFDDSAGIALDSFSGADGSSQGSVTVFLDLQHGISVDQIGAALLGTSATTTAGTPFDFVGNLLSAIASRISAPAASTSDTASTSATSSSATSTPSIANSFFGALFSHLAKWFADAANGITDFFAKRGHFAEELCVGSTCITEAQLAAVLTATNQTPAPPSRTESPPPATSAEPSPTDTATSTGSTGSTSSPQASSPQAVATSSPPTSEPSTSPQPTEASTSSPAVTEPTQPALEQIVNHSPSLAPEEEPVPDAGPPTTPDNSAIEPAPAAQ